MACSESCRCIHRKSCVGYTYITNNVAQEVSTNQLVSPGSVVRTSCIGTIVPTGNNALTVKANGTYKISARVLGFPTAVGSATTGTIQPSIIVNGLVVASAVVSVTNTNFPTEYEVRCITPVCCGDIITISNLGSFTLNLTATNAQGGYNVNIIIERYN